MKKSGLGKILRDTPARFNSETGKGVAGRTNHC
jgi:hypothetical protein